MAAFQPKETAIIYYSFGAKLTTVNSKGLVVSEEDIPRVEAVRKINAATIAGPFLRVGVLPLAINIGRISRIRNNPSFGRDEIEFFNEDGDDILAWGQGRTKTLEIISSFVKANPQFIQVPGYVDILNIRMLGDIRLNNRNCLEFYNGEGKKITTSSVIGQDQAGQILEKWNDYRALTSEGVSGKKPSLDKCPMLKKFGTDLTAQAAAGKIDPIIGRDEEIKRLGAILNRRNKGNPMILGDAGVGKTALAEGLALEIAKGSAPAHLKDKIIVSLDMGTLVAGTKYRGEFEERLEKIVKEAKENKDIILFIDEIHTLVKSGSSEGGLSGGNILKPALARGEIRCIGATTRDEYEKYFASDAALARRFQALQLEELDRDQTRKALGQLVQEKYGDHYNVKVPESVLDAAVDFCDQIDGSTLIDRTIDVLDEALSQADIEGRRILSLDDVRAVIARRTSADISQIGRDDAQILKDLEEGFERAIIAQPKAKKALLDAVRRSRAGLRSPNKPLGSFLFLGPSGVGKTELAKTLAALTNMNFVTLDMSEYMEKHTVSRLIGAPPGYVGYEEEGKLTGPVHRRPHSVVFLDEIVRAHPDIQNVLLQILDEGRLTDGRGRVTRFNHAFIVAAGNMDMKKKGGGGLNMGGAQKDVTTSGSKKDLPKAVTDHFDPAVIGRFDAIISFDPLALADVARIAEHFIAKREKWIERQKHLSVKINVSDDAKLYLAKKGYNDATGARELDGTIKDYVDERIAQEIVGGVLKNGGTVDIGLIRDQKTQAESLSFKFTAAARDKKSAPVNDNKPGVPKKKEDKPRKPGGPA